MSPLPIMSGADWLAMGDNEPPALIEHVLPSRALAFVAGEPGVGKTWLLWDLAFSVLSSRPFVGQYRVVTPGRVLFIATEGGRKASIGRAWAVAAGKGLPAEEAIGALHVLWRPPTFNLTNRENALELVDHVRQHDIKLVVVDTLHGAWGGDENSSQAWGEVMQNVRPIMDAGATVVLVHHNGKQSEGNAGRRDGQRMRGSSAMHGSRDVLFSLAPSKGDPQRVRVTLELRDDAPVPPFTFQTPAHRVGRGDAFALDWQPDDAGSAPSRPEPRARALQLVAEAEGRHTRDTLATPASQGGIGIRRSAALALVDELLEAGELVAVQPGQRLWTRAGFAELGNAQGNATGTPGNGIGNAAAERSRVPPFGGGNAGTATHEIPDLSQVV